MNIDTNKAFKFIFNDTNWIQKLLIGGAFYIGANMFSSFTRFSHGYIQSLQNTIGDSNMALTFLIVFVPIALVLSIASVILTSVPNGYILQSIHNEIKGEEPLLPEWQNNYKKYLINGLISFGIIAIYGFTFALLALIPVSILATVSFVYKENLILSVFSSITMFLFAMVLIITFGIISPFISSTYADNFSFKEALKINEIISKIKKVFPDYLLTIGLSVLITLGYIIMSVLLVCTCVGIVLIPFLSLPVSLIISNMFAQLYKKSIAPTEQTE